MSDPPLWEPLVQKNVWVDLYFFHFSETFLNKQSKTLKCHIFALEKYKLWLQYTVYLCELRDHSIHVMFHNGPSLRANACT